MGRIAVVAVLGLAISGCASARNAASEAAVSSSQQRGLPIPPASTPVSAGTIQAQLDPIHMGGSSAIVFEPPSDGATPSITRADAIATASAHEYFPIAFAANKELVSYGTFIDPMVRQDLGKGSYGPPLLSGKLVVDVRFVGVFDESGGPVGGLASPGASAVVQPPGHVDVNIIIDAKTGERLLTFEDGVG